MTKLFCTCNNCNANIIYEEFDINNQENYIQADPIIQGNLTTWELNTYKKIKKYYINCPQCKKEAICGIEVLEQRVYIE